MTPEQFETIANSCQTRADLEQLKVNALSKGRRDLAELAQDLLETKFPVHTRTRGGATPCRVTFQGRSAEFDTGKAGYIWLVENFGRFRSTVYDEFSSLHRARGSATCRIARSPEGLFPQGSSRVADPNNFARLSSGWFLDANLNHHHKFLVLLQLGHHTGLPFGSAWNFEIVGSTQELAAHQRLIREVEEDLKQLLSQ